MWSLWQGEAGWRCSQLPIFGELGHGNWKEKICTHKVYPSPLHWDWEVVTNTTLHQKISAPLSDLGRRWHFGLYFLYVLGGHRGWSIPLFSLCFSLIAERCFPSSSQGLVHLLMTTPSSGQAELTEPFTIRDNWLLSPAAVKFQGFTAKDGAPCPHALFHVDLLAWPCAHYHNSFEFTRALVISCLGSTVSLKPATTSGSHTLTCLLKRSLKGHKILR